jgi:hypothetical protein
MKFSLSILESEEIKSVPKDLQGVYEMLIGIYKTTGKTDFYLTCENKGIKKKIKRLASETNLVIEKVSKKKLWVELWNFIDAYDPDYKFDIKEVKFTCKN